MNNECDRAVAALAIAGIDKDEATDMVSALYTIFPDATGIDLTQIVLTTKSMRSANTQLLPPELTRFLETIPDLTRFLETMRKNSWLQGWFGKR